MRVRSLTFLCVFFFIPACSDDTVPLADGGGDLGADAGPPDGAPADVGVDTLCEPGLQRVGSACAPVLDSCKGNAVPVPGGGCKQVGAAACDGGIQVPGGSCTAVGVEECQGGIKKPGASTCTPVGVEECTGGLRGPQATTCEWPVGPPATCLTGWAVTSRGWCEPLLPKAECAEGSMAALGSSACQPMGSCGSSTWGDIQLTATTIHVDQAYSGGGSDGSLTKPFTTIGDALKVATANAHIAVAAGTYGEGLSIQIPLRLEGRCAAMVTIKGTDAAKPAVEIVAKVELRDLTVKGPGVGVTVGKGEALLERVAVRECGDSGVQAQAGTKLTTKSCVIADSHAFGVEVRGAEASLTHTVVRDTLSHVPSKLAGTGVLVSRDATNTAKATLADCLVDKNRQSGISVWGADVTIERSVIRDTLPQEKDNTGGGGVLAKGKDSTAATLTMRDTIVAGNQHPGLELLGSVGLLERCVVRDTESRLLDGVAGNGIQAIFSGSQPAKLTMKSCMVAGNRNIALAIAGAEVALERTAVRDTLPQGKDQGFGIGVQAGFGLTDEPASTVTLKECVVADNRRLGVGFWGAKATLERTVVRGTKHQLSDGKWGTGIMVGALGTLVTDLTLSECLVAENRNAGVAANGGAKVTIKRSVVRDTEAQLSDKMYGFGVGGYTGAAFSVEESLILDNRQGGVSLLGADATVASSVVRGTDCQLSDKLLGYGIQAAATTDNASKLTVKDSLISGNTTNGVFVEGASATLERTVVRDTQPEVLDRSAGNGVQVTRSDAGAADLTLKDCLISNNRNAGVILFGASGTIERTIIRDTQPRDSDQETGVGLAAREWNKEPSTLVVQDSTIANNRSIGVRLCGSKATLERTVVRDTLPEAASLAFGYGIAGRQIGPLASELTLRDSVVAGNRSLGVALWSSTATLERSVVRDTLPKAANQSFGMAIQASRMEGIDSPLPSELTLLDSWLDSNRGGSVAIASSSATIKRCVIANTLADLSGANHGDAVSVFPHVDTATGSQGPEATLEISDTVVEDTFRSGLIFYASKGSVHRTVVRRGELSVVLQNGAQPTIGDDNAFVQNEEDRVTVGETLEEVPSVELPPDLD
jgi:hypothetical protein